jgi:hypothetical protein
VKLSNSGKRLVKHYKATRRMTVAATATGDGGRSDYRASFRAVR